MDAITARAQATNRPRARSAAEKVPVLFQQLWGRFAQISTFRFLAKNGMAHVSKKLSVINHWDLRDAAGNAF